MKKTVFLSIVATLAFAFTAQAQLPAITLNDMDGNQVRVDTLAAGRPTIISFFATWCKPCNRELTAIAEVYDEWRQQTGVQLVAVSIDEAQTIQKVKPLVDSHSWPYRILLDPNSELKRALGGQLIPYVVIADGNGEIVYRHNGYTDGAEDELIEVVKKMAKP